MWLTPNWPTSPLCSPVQPEEGRRGPDQVPSFKRKQAALTQLSGPAEGKRCQSVLRPQVHKTLASGSVKVRNTSLVMKERALCTMRRESLVLNGPMHPMALTQCSYVIYPLFTLPSMPRQPGIVSHSCYDHQSIFGVQDMFRNKWLL